MKIYGYTIEEMENETVCPSELAEITLCGSSRELRDIAQFLIDTAQNMDEMGLKYDHEHLSDKKSGFNNSPHFVVSRYEEE